METVPQLNNFAEASAYLARFYDPARTKYDLVNMRRLMEYLGNPQNRLRVIHVAGTSGKTSTAYYMSALLVAAGRKVGLTVSPHINEINERVQINSQPLTEIVFCEALSEFLELVEKSGLKPSWFEIMVAFAYWFFALSQVDFAVVEVGLGGLKDGTNVVSRADKICIITDIGYDHMKILGNSLAEIAAQKAGIIQPYNEVFCYGQKPAVMQVLQNAAAGQNARLHVVKEAGNHTAMPDYQFRNWFLASEVFAHLAKQGNLLNMSSKAFKASQSTHVPGRMDILDKDNKTVVLDGAHNVQKMTALCHSFSKLFPGRRPAVLIGLKEGKDYQQVVSPLSQLASRVITTGFDLSQDMPLHSIEPEKLADSFRQAGTQNVSVVRSQAEAVAGLLAGPEDICLITGSLYLIGQLRSNDLV